VPLTAEDISARLELRALVDAYALAIDRRDPGAFADVFEADGELRIFEPDAQYAFQVSAGREQIAAVVGMLDVYVDTQHLMANHVVMLDGDAAQGVVYCLARHILPEGPEDLLMVIEYRDRYVRNDGEWRIAIRDCHVKWTERSAASKQPLWS
jgi:hypothetical protein